MGKDQVVWEGWHREVSPYPDHRRILVVAARSGEGLLTIRLQTSIIVQRKPVSLSYSRPTPWQVS